MLNRYNAQVAWQRAVSNKRASRYEYSCSTATTTTTAAAAATIRTSIALPYVLARCFMHKGSCNCAHSCRHACQQHWIHDAKGLAMYMSPVLFSATSLIVILVLVRRMMWDRLSDMTDSPSSTNSPSLFLLPTAISLLVRVQSNSFALQSAAQLSCTADSTFASSDCSLVCKMT